MTLSLIRYHRYAIFILTAAYAQAQAGRAELFGTVRDPAGLPVPAAEVLLQEENTGLHYNTTASSAGDYHFSALPSGAYRLEVREPRFAVLRHSGIELRVADRAAIDLTLTLGGLDQTVVVTAAAPMLQTSSGALGHVVDRTQIMGLPLDGRNFIPLIALAPGVMIPPGQLLPRINGSRPRTSEYLYDGIAVLQPEPGQVAYFPVLDSIEEFRLQTNTYSAEYGRSNGGVIQVSTRSGANTLHGSVFEYFRNEAMNARNLFALPGAKPLFRRNLYGVAIGGPFRRNRTFFFADWQGARSKIGVTRFSTVPTDAQRQGIFTTAIVDPATGAARVPFANRTIPAERYDSAARALLARYPLATIAAAANNYARSGADVDNGDQFDTRLDHSLTGRQRIFTRYSFFRDDARPMTPLPDGSGALTTAVNGNTSTRADSMVAEHTWAATPAAANQLRFGWTRRGFEAASNAAGATYEVAGFQQLGPPSATNGRLATSVTEAMDDYAFVHGAHSLKIGADLRWERLNVFQPPNPAGHFQFTAALTGNALASFLLGAVQNYSLDIQQDTLRPRAHIAELFLQDDWRLTPRLTINPGVRYTLNFPSTEANHRSAVFNLASQKLDYAGQNGAPESARNLEKHNFGPRMGLAYRVADSFAIRAGYGLVWIERSGITTPFTSPMFPFIQTLSQNSLDNLSPAFSLAQGPSVHPSAPGPDSGLGQGVFGVQRENGSGYAQQWNFTLQKTIGSNWSASVGYAGSKLTRLGVPDTNLNQLTVQDLSMGALLTTQVANPFAGQVPAGGSLAAPTVARQQLLRPYPRFTTVTLYRNNVGNSTYHSLQAHLERRFSAGFTLTASYTFSKLIDDAGSVFNSALLTGPVAAYQAADSFNRRLEKDESTGSIPHVFTSGIVWQRRGGWEVAAFLKAQSGMPMTVVQSTNLNAAFGFGIQRPNLTGNPLLPADQRSTGHYFNTAAFTGATQFTLGSASRNPVRGPGYQSADLMVGKTLALTDRLRVEVRAEVFNAGNTPPLGQPNGNFGAAAFGSIATAGDPRVFELAARLKF